MPAPILSSLLIALLLSMHAGSVSAETVTVAGSGGMIPLLTALGSAYTKKFPFDDIQVNPNSLTESGGILAAKSGAVDIGMSARNLDARELLYSIDAYHIADVAADIAVHRNVKVTDITTQQLCAVYAGKITNWRELGGHDARIIVLTRPDRDSTKHALRSGVACFRELRETTEAISMQKTNNMLTALQHAQDSIGIIDSIVLQKAEGKAVPLRLDGRTATAAEIVSGRWPIIKEYTLIVNKVRKKGVDRFMRFIRSQDGAALISRFNGIPVSFSYP